ncbi:hypothetical protein KM043_016204 [Ampulex compressa]|nr:hypothetical protein KM043_016204 [Ampulex compressa]
MNTIRLFAKSLFVVRAVNYEGQRTIKRWVAPVQKEITRRKRKLPPQPEPKRSNFIEWNRTAELYAFSKRLSEDFDNNKLEQALTNKSYILQEKQRQKDMGIEDPVIDIEHNESFALQGETLTSNVITKYLTKSLPRMPEAGIEVLHDYLMSKEILAKACLHIGTKDLILTAEHPVSEETLANTFFALVTALAESVDVNRASNFVKDFLIVGLADKDLSEIWSPSNPLEILNNIFTQENKPLVEPRIIAHAGKNTLLSTYQIAMYSDKKFLGSGYGQTIEEAKHTAATNALCRLFGLLDSSRPLKFNSTLNIS